MLSHPVMFHLTAKKSLGQHFLVDPKIHHRIVEAFAPISGDVAIEIGPGTGLLTRELLASPLARLIAFELDARAISELRSMFASEGPRFRLVEQDFLETNLTEIAAHEKQKLRAIGNIPYYITSPIIFKLIDERKAVSDAVLLVQKEVAERLTAQPHTKEYGIPTVLANFFGEVRYLFTVRAGAFRPVPKVDSALMRIDFGRDYFTRVGGTCPSDFDEPSFRKLVRGLFAMRRKTIRNNLRAMLTPDQMQRIEAREPETYLGARAEELSIPDFLALFSVLNQIAP